MWHKIKTKYKKIYTKFFSSSSSLQKASDSETTPPTEEQEVLQWPLFLWYAQQTSYGLK